MNRMFRRALQPVMPPALFDAVVAVKRFFVPPRPGYREVATLAEADAELARAAAATGPSHDAHFAVLDSFGLKYPTDLPRDPFSAEYRAAQMAFYAEVAGRTDYAPAECELTPIDDERRAVPYPYYTRSTRVVGEQLQAIGFVVKALAAPPGATVAEFGCGFGRLTLEMARTGLNVTAVEISPDFVDLLRANAAREGLPVTAVRSAMLDFRPAHRFDRAVFYESFHHCDDHGAMLDRLRAVIAPGGAVLFAGEPIMDELPIPWGVRRDGRSLWCVRRHGWLELGFRTDYFLSALKRHGWRAEVLASRDVPWNRVFVARPR
jgi:SAM-dependent methyltransferase